MERAIRVIASLVVLACVLFLSWYQGYSQGVASMRSYLERCHARTAEAQVGWLRKTAELNRLLGLPDNPEIEALITKIQAQE